MSATATAACLRERLEELLAESGASAAKRERYTFDEAAHGWHRRIVIYGSGGLGRRTLAGLRANGVEPLAFVDRNPALWNTPIEGVPVFSPEAAARQFACDSVFVIAVWNPVVSGGIDSIRADLAAKGCRRIAPFTWLFWKYSETFLPYYLWALPSLIHRQQADVREAFALFEGRRSQTEFIRQLELRLTGDVACLIPPEKGAQYFPGRLFRPRADEYFVDCGAYNGDTLHDLMAWTGGSYRGALAFEADPANFAALERRIDEDVNLKGRARAIQAAVGPRRAKVRFAASGLASAAVSESGGIEVDSLPLDECLAKERATYIKMDIEGAEMDALQGASEVLRAQAPLLAICAYHTQDHLWQIPLRISRLMPEGRLLLLPHCMDGFDLVCYAVPPDRAIDSSLEDTEP